MEIIDVDRDYLKPWKKIFSNTKSAVYVAKHRISEEEHVIKKIQIPQLEEVDDYYTEVLIHARVIPHPNIVKILGRKLKFKVDEHTGQTEAELFIVLERMTRSLKEEIIERAQEQRPYTHQEISRFGSQIVEGLLHIQSMRAWHRDLKPLNM